MVDPQNGWFILENPIKMDDDWGYPPRQETSISKDRFPQLLLQRFALLPESRGLFCQLTNLGRVRGALEVRLQGTSALGSHGNDHPFLNR